MADPVANPNEKMPAWLWRILLVDAVLIGGGAALSLLTSEILWLIGGGLIAGLFAAWIAITQMPKPNE